MSNSSSGKRGLGRGLSTLIGDLGPGKAEELGSPSNAGGGAPTMMPIEMLRSDPTQPRTEFPEDSLKELADSIRASGIIQPIVARPSPDNVGGYRIVAGERRWRAAQLAMLREVPVAVRELSDEQCLEISIIENIQREGLNPLDEARGYKSLMDRFGHTQEKISETLGKSRSHVANILRLLSLPSDVQKLIVEGRITAGHARALVPAKDPAALARTVVRHGMSVRQTEALAKRKDGGHGAAATPKPRKDADTEALEAELSANLGSKVRLQLSTGNESGKIVISFENLDKLSSLTAAINDAAANLREAELE